MNHNRLFRVALLLGVLLGATSDGFSKTPATFSGVITAVSDGDSYTVKVCHGKSCTLYKVRLHAADCPEVKHYRTQTDQPGGRAARDYVVKTYLGQEVTISPVGRSYGRLVAKVQAGEKDFARDLIARGHAMLDTRYSKDKDLQAAQDQAACDDLGIWAGDANPVPAWEWRREGKTRIIQQRKK